MNRQKLTLLSIVGIFVILLVVRAFTGNGFGRIYVERGEASSNDGICGGSRPLVPYIAFAMKIMAVS